MVASNLSLQRRGFAEALLLASASLMDVAGAADAQRPAMRGMSLEQAIAVLEQDGLNVIFSSSLIKPWMRVRTEPTAASADGALAQLVAPFGLSVREASQGMFAIVRGGQTPPTIPHEAHTENAANASHVDWSDDAPLREVVIVASRYELTRSLTEPSTSLSGTDIEHLPDLGDDALRAVARLPGTTTNGLTARSNVRGGVAGETLVKLDGVRLYNPFHLKDFQSVFSAIDPRIVSTVDVYTGGFASRFGDRMSGVLDIASLAPPGPRYREINASFFNTSLLSAGRFAEDRGEWVASFRRSNLDFWYHALRDTPGTPTYADGFGKVSWQLNHQLRVTAGTLLFGDEIGLSMEDDEERANADYKDRYFWLRLDHQPNAHMRGTTLISHAQLDSSRLGSVSQDGVSEGSLSDEREFHIESIATDWAWRAGESWLVEFGGELTRARGQYDYRDEVEFDVLIDTPGAEDSVTRNRDIHVRQDHTRYALHAALRHDITTRLATDVGLRWESARASPRIGMRYQLAPDLFLRAGWARVYQSQGIDELDVADGAIASSPPQRADHFSAGLERRFDHGITLRADLYEKRLRHIRPRYENLLNPLTLVPELSPDRILIAPDQGRARGAEVLLTRKDAGPLTWWIGYTWSSARERLDGDDVRRSWDQPHALSAGFDWSSGNWNIGAALIQRTGWPTTAVSLESGEPVPVLQADGRNLQRARTYRSVDVRIERRFVLDHSSLGAFLEVTNLLGRDNACCSAYEIDDESGELELERRSYVPRIPSLGFLWQF